MAESRPFISASGRSAATPIDRSETPRVAIIGDVGGFARQLEHCLAGLGIGEGRWPTGLHVIQVGDLLGGHDDLDCIRIVEPHLHAGRWTQLIGNWELGAVGGPETMKRGVGADPRALAAFSRWHDAGLVRYAVWIKSATGRTAIITHAGLTPRWWHEHAGSERDESRTVAMINAAPDHALHTGGEMIGRPDLAPAPVWASTRELWGGWMNAEPLPWTLVHGHSATYDCRRGWLPWVPTELIQYAVHNPELRHTRFTPPGQNATIIGIDPGLWTRTPVGALHPLTVETV